MRRLWAPLLGVGLVVAVLAPLLCTNLILARGDTFLYFYPYWDARAAALRDLRLPLWTPDVFMGVPFLANPQTGVLYPLNWLVAPFSAPLAVKISLGLHAVLAWLGMAGLARRSLALSRPAALLSATTFALGGYLLAQAEHINQFQALAWFPWLAWILTAGSLSRLRRLLLASLVVALQVLAGHTQSVVISGLGAALWVVTERAAHTSGRWTARLSAAAAGLLPLIGAALIAALLAAGQLLPTAELQQLSLRSGGLEWRDAVSFSLDPRLLSLALLPGYSRSLFTEFVASPGLIALGLAAVGAAAADRRRWPALVITLLGLAFAFGAYDPIYAGLAFFPPFNLFRVPARWLFLFAAGVALLAGLGLDALKTASPRTRWAAAAVAVALLAGVALSIGRTPAGETGPIGRPAWADLLGWGAALATLLVLLWRGGGQRWAWLAVSIATLEVGLGARALPLLADLTAPEAYTSLRPALLQLLVDPARSTTEGPPPGRVVSMSALQFDPGDLGELRDLYGPQLSAAGLETLIVATKHKEVLSPNLALTWHVPSVDGFDGGILPTRAYAEFTSLFTGELSSDGRLREHVTAAPDPRWLALVNARWLIADKTGDVWLDGVYYDTLLARSLAAGEAARLAIDPAFPADRLGVLSDTGGRLTILKGESRAEFTFEAGHSLIDLPFAPETLELIGPTSVQALTVLNTQSGAFQSVPLRAYRLAHSGDVKVYEVLDRLPRAFVARNAEVVSTAADALARMSDPAFVPEDTALLLPTLVALPQSNAAPASVAFVESSAERVVLEATGPGLLVLTDANYPGWKATVDGEDTPIVATDIVFRGLALGPGKHTVVFTFAPSSVTFGLTVSLATAALWLLAGIVEVRRTARRRAG